MKKSLIRKYARTVAVVGGNVQKGQSVIVCVEPENEDFGVMLAEECYKAGAGCVAVEFYSNKVTKVDVRYRTLKSLKTVPKWGEAKAQQEVDDCAVRILVESDDPNALKGVNVAKMRKAHNARRAVMKKYSDALEGRQQWCICAVPSKKWAKTVFPGDRPAAAVEKLWKAILETVYVTEDNDPVEAWQRRREDFERRCGILNGLGLKELEIKTAKGTDLKIGLIPGMRFEGGGSTTLSGVYFVPNLPTEEIFTSPMRGVVEGTAVATMPLSYNGVMIEDFSVTFRGGKAVEWHAAKGEEMLTQIIKTDDGAAMLGEVAFVPVGSSVGKTGLLFLKTLFDENSSCHLALGTGFPDLMPGFENMTLEQIREAGVNDSLTHVDFMIGDETYCATGITSDGRRVKLLENGKWVI